MGELVIEKVSVKVCDSVEVESLSVSSRYTGWISECCCGFEV